MRNINLILIFLYCTSTCIDNINATKPQLYPKYQSFIQRSKRDSSVSFNDTIEQLEQIASFVNGLILTEAVVEGTTNLSTLATDFLIIGQLPKGADWIEKVGSREVADGKTDQLIKLYGQTYQLRDILDHGLNSSIDVNVVKEFINAFGNLDIVERIATNAQRLLDLVQNFKENPLETDLTTYKDNTRDFFKLPNLVEKLRDEPNFGIYIEYLHDALQIPFKAKSAEASKTLGNAISNYKNSIANGDPDLKKPCLTKLKKSLAGLELGNFTHEAVDFLRSFFEFAEIATNVKSLETVQSKLEIIKQLHSRFFDMANIKSYDLSENDAKAFSGLIDSLTKMKTVELEGLYLVLQSLNSVANVGREMYNLFESNETTLEHGNESFVNKFKSYSGFEDGIDSFENMAKELVVSNKLPIQFVYSPINYRSELVQKLSSKISSVAQFSTGLPLMSYIKSALQTGQEFVVPSNFDNRLAELKNFTDSLPAFQEISSIFGEFAYRIQLSEEYEWRTNLGSLISSFPDVEVIKKFEKLLAPIPDVIVFERKLREAIGDVLMNTDEEEWKKDEIEKRFEDITKIIETIEKGKEFVDALVKAADDENSQSSLLKPSLDSFKNVIENSTLFQNWTSTIFNYTADQIVGTLKYLATINVAMKTVEGRMNDINKTIAELSKFEPLKELVNDTFDSNLAESATKLIEAIVDAKFEDTELVDEPSEAMARLMNGSTFGAEILDDLRQGIIGYRSLLNGIESTTMLESYISTLSSNGSELMGQVKKLLNGVERLQIVTPPFSNNALQYLDNFSKIIKNIDSAVNWIYKAQAKEKANTAQDLEALMGTFNDTETEDALQHLHSFISQINNSTAKSFGRLKIGLKKFVDALSYVNCTKIPDHKSCRGENTQANGTILSEQVIEIVTEKVESSNSVFAWVGGAAGFIAVLVVCGVIAYLCKWRRDKKKEEEELKIKEVNLIQKEDEVNKIQVDITEQNKKLQDRIEERDQQLANVVKHNIELDIQKNRQFPALREFAEGAITISRVHKGEFEFAAEKYYHTDATLSRGAMCVQHLRCEMFAFGEYFKRGTNIFKQPTWPLLKKGAVVVYKDKPMPQIHANHIPIIKRARWIACACPASTTQGIEAFFTMLHNEKTKVLIRLGNPTEFEDWEYDYAIDGSDFYISIEDVPKKVEELCRNVITHKKLNINIPGKERITMDYLFCRHYYLMPLVKTLHMTLIKHAYYLSETDEKNPQSIVVQTTRACGKAMNLIGAAYMREVIEHQVDYAESEPENTENIDDFALRCVPVHSVVNRLREYRFAALPAVYQYAVFEMDIALICQLFATDKNRSRIESIISNMDGVLFHDWKNFANLAQTWKPDELEFDDIKVNAKEKKKKIKNEQLVDAGEGKQVRMAYVGAVTTKTVDGKDTPYCMNDKEFEEHLRLEKEKDLKARQTKSGRFVKSDKTQPSSKYKSEKYDNVNSLKQLKSIHIPEDSDSKVSKKEQKSEMTKKSEKKVSKKEQKTEKKASKKEQKTEKKASKKEQKTEKK